MTTFVNNDVSSGSTIFAADHNTMGALIAAVLNGGIDNANIATAAAIAGSKLADGAITNAKLATTTGEIGAVWQSWTPTLANITTGTNGTSTGKYIQIGKVVFFTWRFVFSSTGTPSTVGTAPTITLPVTGSANVLVNNHLGGGTAYDDSAVQPYPARMTATSTTVAKIWCEVASGTFNAHGNVTSTQPFTWANLDTLQVNGVYEAA